jgi:hypothetical protein
MSNVVQLFSIKPQKKSIDTAGLVAHITDWAEEQGVDIEDQAFRTRCEDLVTWLHIMAKDSI